MIFWNNKDDQFQVLTVVLQEIEIFKQTYILLMWNWLTITGFPWTDLTEIDPWKDVKDWSPSIWAGRSACWARTQTNLKAIRPWKDERSIW